jgi:SanA protein
MDQVPSCEWILVLGCAPKLTSGVDNFYFTARVAATAQLVAAGKAHRVLVSGGPLRKPLTISEFEVNSEADYMKATLVELGIDAGAIEVDRQGLRTRLSVERALVALAPSGITIVSQGFHTPRAIYLAAGVGLRAHAYNAAEPPWSKSRLKIELRELLSRVRAFWEK